MIGLMDCNNFFVSCERLFRPDLRNKPVLVLSSNDGCVVARSQEVKDLGIAMGIPFFQVKDLCKKHKITVFSSNFQLYRDISRRVMAALREEYEYCEVYSVDEAFFTVQDTVDMECLMALRSRIIQKTGIPVSIGMAQTKTLAKVANSIAKKGDGVSILNKEMWDTISQELPCGAIWGIGRQTALRLNNAKIVTAADFLTKDLSFVRNLLGVVGERLHMELSGVSAVGFENMAEYIQESYMSTRSFSHTKRGKEILIHALSHHVTELAVKLRRDGNTARTMTIIARGSRYGDFAQRKGSLTCTLEYSTNETQVLIKKALDLLEELYDPEIPYKKAGIVLGGIFPECNTTGSLFISKENEKVQQVIDKIVDRMNSRFGAGKLQLGTLLYDGSWSSNKASVSKAYTTDWTQIAIVRAV
jgi:DNA polymerase V